MQYDSNQSSPKAGQQDIGLFGGTFDPVHNGHLEICRYVLRRHHLDAILFIPAPYPPHKLYTKASFKHRVAMLRLALVNEPDMQVSLIEEEHRGRSYTVDTIETLKKKYPETRYSLIIGGDSLQELRTWHRSERLLSLVDVIVAGRRDQTPSFFVADCVKGLKPEFQYDQSIQQFRSTANTKLIYHGHLHIPVSSSQVRSQLQSGICPSGLDPVVQNYIQEHNLYR
ncbi:MAG: nicotinate (nicotinamide) nucleotide adenylyltransferase [Desulfobulbus propionicus]|nr:MAG: nicotinate (nicotinamide) nucleotide adenylyltransferase [Desulfobulbus propionicus]